MMKRPAQPNAKPTSKAAPTRGATGNERKHGGSDKAESEFIEKIRFCTRIFDFKDD
jgi:hypothetical protein